MRLGSTVVAAGTMFRNVCLRADAAFEGTMILQDSIQPALWKVNLQTMSRSLSEGRI
jgi:hypothetical protein